MFYNEWQNQFVKFITMCCFTENVALFEIIGADAMFCN